MDAVPGKTRKTDSKLTVAGKQKVEWQGYVTFEITQAAKKALEKFVDNGNDPLTWLPKIAADGVYEIKTKWDTYNNCWVTNIYCAKYGHQNAGWSLPARASDYWESQRRAAFIHLEVLKEGWNVALKPPSWNDERW